MEYLEALYNSPEIAYYEIKDASPSEVDRYIFSTPQTRTICNVPEVVGIKYTTLMGEAMSSALKHLPEREALLKTPEEKFCVFTFLRGGLNFCLRDALFHAFGFNNHGASFMTSQRYMEDGTWHIKENQYRKLEIPDNATLLVGDVVATGVTLEEGFTVILDYLRAHRIRLENLVFFTIGCGHAERVFGEVDRKLKAMNPSYGRTIVVYIEGKFTVAEQQSNLKIKIPGTDLLRTDALVSPEFALSQYENDTYPIERCTIYDAGSRSFDIPEYMHDVIDYWQQVEKLAGRGFTLYEALKERWPETGWESFQDFAEIKGREWRGIEESFLKDLHSAYKSRWNGDFLERARTSGALLDLCRRRLEVLNG